MAVFNMINLLALKGLNLLFDALIFINFLNDVALKYTKSFCELCFDHSRLVHTYVLDAQIRFSSVPERSTLSAMIKQLKLSDRPQHALRKMEAADVPAVHTLLCESLSK